MKCPSCGKEVNTIREWDLSPKLRIKLYECGCGKKFREYVKKEGYEEWGEAESEEVMEL